MADLPVPLPARRPELVCWKAAEPGQYVVRQRQAGESFTLREEEYFLLEQLDGRQTAPEVCRAFSERFGEPLSEEELHEFVALAGGRGLLQGPHSPAVGPLLLAPVAPAARPLLRRLAARSVRLLAGALRWPARLLNAAAERLDHYRLNHLDYLPRPDDIFIVTYPRSGTTWMQMILYQLTTDGSMDIPHIAEFCPWFERSLRSGLGFESRPSPRIFKTHLRYSRVPRGPCRYIYVARDGRDVAVSCYHLCRRYNGYTGTFPEFFDLFLRGKAEFGSWFDHVKGWWAHRNDPNVLFLTYEELTSNLEASLRRVADFCGLAVPGERMPVILERCSFAFMKRYEALFDPALETLWEQGIQLNSFLRSGKVGEGGVALDSGQEERFAEVYRRHLAGTGIGEGSSRIIALAGPFCRTER